MTHAPQRVDCSPPTRISTGQILFLVLYMFAGLMLTLTASSALAKPPSCQIVSPAGSPIEITAGDSLTYDGRVTEGDDPYQVSWSFEGGTPASDSGTIRRKGSSHTSEPVTYDTPGSYTTSFVAVDKNDETCTASTVTVNVLGDQGDGGGDVPPDGEVPPDETGVTARGDTYATPVGRRLDVAASRVSGVLYNDFGGTPPLTAQLVSGPSSGNLTLNPDGSFSYTPNPSLGDNANDSFVYQAVDSLGVTSAEATVNINILSDQPDFKIMMNYELGMHCTGFEFAYCCVLPPYNSILAQVVKSESNGGDFPRLLEGDPHNGLDGLGRETVVRDYELDGTFKKYYLEYFHDAQPRREGQGKRQRGASLISAVEGNSLFYHQTIYDSAALDANGALVTGSYEGVDDVVLGDGDFNDPTDNYANGWLNHLYIYADLEGSNPNNSSLEADKIRLGVTGHVEYPADVGAALQPMGPTGSRAGFNNVLTFSADTGTVVYTQMKVLENLPVMLTSPRIWEALGLPLTPFEDTVDFFADPGLVDEDSIRPYVAMKARLHEANCDEASGNCSKGPAVLGSNGKPVIGFGTAPIDIPNCERCHSVPATDGEGNPNINSPSYIRSDFAFPHAGPLAGASLEAVTDAEYQFWNAYYDIVPGVDSDWYSRLKGAAINMLSLHDFDQGTGFTSNWPAGSANDPIPQNTRLGKESVICQKCHADNVIAVVKSATKSGAAIKPISESIHWRHREVSEGGTIDFADAAGRSGGCQGCHPAHRSDGVMDGYPITVQGDNEQADGDNRLAAGGCFVGRDVHSNVNKDIDGAETPEHLNAVGQWLADNVFHNQDGVAGVAGNDTRGLWCTNCHTQLGQELWRTEDCDNLITGDCRVNPRGENSLAGVARAVGVSEAQAIAWLDPTAENPLGDFSHTIWDPAVSDADVATIEVDGSGNPVVTTDADGDISVNILSFCTTADCINTINANKADSSQWRYPANPFIDPASNRAAAVPFSAATDGRDHWLSAGEPHCADCHAAPYVEQSGNNNPFPPFNYPAKASLMRYSRGHRDLSCQSCHESIHGLYPVTPTIDATSYAQAASLNHDGSHGPLKCGACHDVNASGVPTIVCAPGSNDGECDGGPGLTFNGTPIYNNYDAAVSWAHSFTDEADLIADTAGSGSAMCLNCHGDESHEVSANEKEWLEHAETKRVTRKIMDQTEIELLGAVAGSSDPLNTVCQGCHEDKSDEVSCSDSEWREHLTRGRVAESVWEEVSGTLTGSRCGW